MLNSARVSVAGSKEAEYDSKTWPELHKLTLRTPEAGVHLQGAKYQIIIFQDDYLPKAENVVYDERKILKVPRLNGSPGCCQASHGSAM